MDNKSSPLHILCTRDSLHIKRHTQTKKRDKKSYFVKMETIKSGVAIYTPDKIHLKKMTKQNRNRLTDKENILMIARWEEGWRDG